MKKINYIIFLLFVTIINSIFAQDPARTIDLNNPHEGTETFDYVARESITLGTNFSYKAEDYSPQKITARWLFIVSPETPSININGVAYTSPFEMDSGSDEEDFLYSGQLLGNLLQSYLGSDWKVEYNGTAPAFTLEITGVEAAFTYSGNYNSVVKDQDYQQVDHSFTASIDEAIVLDVDYLEETEIPNANTRTLITTSDISVGSTPASFNVSPTGAATYNVPIAVPPGTAGMQPLISIGYNSQAGSGLLGMGWNLNGLSAISRVPATMYHDGFTDGVDLETDDRFALDGNRLMLTSTGEYGGNGTEYKTESETFIMVTAHDTNGDKHPEYFVAETRDGTTIEFGKENNSAKLVSGKALAWSVSKIIDEYGNYITFHYKNNNGEFYIEEIKYTGNNTSTPVLEPNSSVKFFYEDKTSDAKTAYMSGEAIYQKKIIHKVRSSHNGEVLREYDFKYFEDNFTQLCEVIETNGEGEKYNSTVFSWNDENLVHSTIECTQFSTQTYPSSFYSGDFNNDGISDLLREVEISGIKYIRVYIADIDNVQTNAPSFTLVDDRKTTDYFYGYVEYILDDLTGDGQSNIIVSCHSGSSIEYFINNDVNNLDIFKTVTLANRLHDKIPISRIGDINGDGIDDIITFDTYEVDQGHKVMVIYGNNNFNSIVAPLASDDIWVHGYNEEHYKNLSPGDYNGDGRTDLMVISDNGYRLYYDLPNDDVFSEGTNIKKANMIREGDFNSDGKTDLLVNSSGLVWNIYTNTGDGFISEPVVIPNYNQDDHDDIDFVWITDLNNDGLPDIASYNEVYHRVNGDSELDYAHCDFFVNRNGTFEDAGDYRLSSGVYGLPEVYNFGDFNGDGNVEVLSFRSDKKLFFDFFTTNLGSNKIKTIADGFNNKIAIEYLPLTDDVVYTKTLSKSFPLVTTNAPVYVTSKVTKDDGMGGQSITTNKYEDAIIHKQGKGFLGFLKTSADNSNLGTETKLFSINGTYYFPQLDSTLAETANGTDVSGESYTYFTSSKGNNRYFKYVKNHNTFDLLDNNTTKKAYRYVGDNLTEEQININNGESEVERIFSSFNAEGSPGNVQITYKRNDYEYDMTRAETYTYWDNGRLKTKTIKELTTSYTYDDFGNVETETIGIGAGVARTTINIYSTDGRFIEQQKDPNMEVTKFTYNDWGKLLETEDPNGLKTINEYDAWGKLTKTTNPTGTYTRKKLAWAGGTDKPTNALYYTEITDEDGDFNGAEYYDMFGRTIRSVTVPFRGKKLYTDTEYNAKGQVTTVTGPYVPGTPDKVTTYTYTSDNRVLTETLPTGIVKTYDYSVDNKVKTTYSTGEIYSKTIDGSGLVMEAKDPGGTITYSYFADGLVKNIVAPGGTVSMNYYATTRLQQSLTDPDAGTMTYSYNQFGEMLTQTDDEGNVTTMTYDILGRVKTKQVNTENTITYNYDEDKYGTLSNIMRNSVKEFEYTYNDLLLPLSETRRDGSESFTYNYTYDTEGNVKTMTYPSGLVLTYTYNSLGNLTQINKGSNVIWRLDEINNIGQLTKAYVRNNNQQITYGYDTYDRLNSIVAPNIINFGYTFNNINQLDERKEKYWVSSQWQGIEESFSYDDVNRLETASGGESLVMDYKDSPNDRIENKSDLGDYKYQASDNHKVDRIENPSVSLPVHSIEYASNGKTESITEPAGNKVLTITYGVDNQRFKTEYTNNSQNVYTRYFFNSYEKEVPGTGSEKELSYIYAYGSLVAIHEGDNSTGETHYVYTDYLGSIRCITSETGTIEHKLSFDAWGNRRDVLTGAKLTSAPTGLLTARGFTGHEHLDNFGLINMNGRIYEPIMGMFLSPDNDVQMPDFTQNFNRYSYCLNNPLMYTDPSGENFWSIFGMLAKAYLDGVAVNNYEFNPLNWNWSNPGTYVAVASGAFGGYHLGSAIDAQIEYTHRLNDKRTVTYSYSSEFGYSTSGGATGFILSKQPDPNSLMASVDSYSSISSDPFPNDKLPEWLNVEYTASVNVGSAKIARFFGYSPVPGAKAGVKYTLIKANLQGIDVADEKLEFYFQRAVGFWSISGKAEYTFNEGLTNLSLDGSFFILAAGEKWDKGRGFSPNYKFSLIDISVGNEFLQEFKSEIDIMPFTADVKARTTMFLLFLRGVRPNSYYK